MGFQLPTNWLAGFQPSTVGSMGRTVHLPTFIVDFYGNMWANIPFVPWILWVEELGG